MNTATAQLAPQALIPVFQAEIGGILTNACDARALHTFLDVGRDFTNWIKARIKQYGFIENSDYVDGIVSNLTIKFENGDIKQCKTQKLKLIEPEQDELEVPDVKFSSILNLPSADFQKIIRDLSCISDKIEIKSVGNEIIFKCQGQFASAEIHRAESDGSMGFIVKQDSSKIIQGEFSLKNLGYFIKCTNLCSQIEMYLENDLPLVVKYDVASLGSIRLALVPLPST